MEGLKSVYIVERKTPSKNKKRGRGLKSIAAGKSKKFSFLLLQIHASIVNKDLFWKWLKKRLVSAHFSVFSIFFA